MEDLSNIVRVRRLHSQGIYCGYHQTGQQVWLCNGCPVEAGEEEDVQRRPGDKHSRKIYKRCESAGLGVVFTEWLVIGVGGKISSPNAPAGVGGSKSKSK